MAASQSSTCRTPLMDEIYDQFLVNQVQSNTATLNRLEAFHSLAGQVVVLESTTYPGTTRDLVRPILERNGLKAGKDFFLAYSPEREDPGRQDYSTETIPKLVGGYGPGAGRQQYAGAHPGQGMPESQ